MFQQLKESPVKQGRYVQGLSVVFCCRSDSRRSGSNCEEEKKKNPCCHPSLAPVHPITETAGFQLSVSALHTTHKAAISGPLNRHPGSYILIFSLPPLPPPQLLRHQHSGQRGSVVLHLISLVDPDQLGRKPPKKASCCQLRPLLPQHPLRCGLVNFGTCLARSGWAGKK